MDTSAEGLIKLNDQMRSEVSGMVGLWDECGRYCLTRKIQALNAGSNRTATDSSFTPDQRLLNTVAVEANKTLAAGRLSWTTPSDSPWFVWKPAPQLEESEATESWLAKCTEIAQLYLGASNFYTCVHESFLDNSTFGTSSLFAEEGRSAPLNFKTFDVGTFVLGEDESGMVNMVFREIEYTAFQAKEAFGQLPAQVEADVANKPLTRHRFLHAIYERPESEQNAQGGPQQKRFASCWVHMATKMKVKEGGYDELPTFVMRYLRWSESSPYGASPAMEALAEIRGVNYLELLLSTMAEVTVSPRIILPQNYQGAPDLRAGGITMGGLTRDTFPQEWMTGGRIDFGLELLQRKERMIQEIFHRPLFDQFAQIERQITATEVRVREAEKLVRFSPAFTRQTTELINPVLERVFMLLFRAGKFPPPPREALMQDAYGEWMLLYPRVIQTSRMALALQALKRSALGSIMEYALPLVQTGSPVLDNFDLDKAIRDIGRGEGAPDSWVKESEAVEATRKARAEAQAQAQQAAMMAEAMKSKPIAEAGVAAITGKQAA